MKFRPLYERFIEKIYKDKVTGCWFWTAHRTVRGYGTISDEKRRQKAAHRLSYEFFKGPIGTLYVCHHCDRPSCVNPNHLFLGTPKDNTHDMMMKGKNFRGERCGMAKLTNEDVFEIRRLVAEGKYYHREIGVMFGVSYQTIGKIIKGIRWTHI